MTPILTLHAQGLSPAAIVRRGGGSRAQVYRALSAAGLKPHLSGAYLSPTDRREMEVRLRAGEAQRETAAWFGVSQARVSQIAIGLGLRRRGGR